MSEFVNETPADVTCPAYGYQSATVCVPVTVRPFAIVGATTTTCCGTPIVTPVVTPRPAACAGRRNGTCTFLISQDICVTVPVSFGARATGGDTFVSCDTASAEDICTDCGDEDAE